MRPQHNRLGADAPRGLAGTAINRARPLTFQLDGRLISGFEGDTVLSAAMASGVDTLGHRLDLPIALSPSAAPAIAPANGLGDTLPMARTPAHAGADYVTVGGKRPNMLARLFLPGRSLGLPLDEPHVLDEPWRATPGTDGEPFDLVVIGGGVAGMSAALAGERAGLRVCLVESSPRLGGYSGLFGTLEGEDQPEDSMGRLRDAVVANDAISVLTSAHVFGLRPGKVRLHQAAIVDGRPVGKVLDLATRFIVIATGARERLPIFPGNRLPGVVGTLDAYELAARYGVWHGHRALVATSSNFAYRLAMLASDAGIAIDRVLDGRPGPASRFIEFSRAYGMVQATATAVGAATQKSANELAVALDTPASEPLATERLLVCGGWQPDLTLWHIAGGASRWSAERHRLEAAGTIETMVLAGSAAGWMTRTGSIQSGADAIDLLLGRPRKPVADNAIDPIYETPDGPVPIASSVGDEPAYLDSGAEFLQRPLPRRRTWLSLFGRRNTGGLTALSEAPQPLAINDVAAGVDLGLIPPDAAGGVAQERVALVSLASPIVEDALAESSAPQFAEVPDYLLGRFGADARVCRVVPAGGWHFEPGALVFADPDLRNPLEATGVVLRADGHGAAALLANGVSATGRQVHVRDRGQPVPSTVAPLND